MPTMLKNTFAASFSHPLRAPPILPQFQRCSSGPATAASPQPADASLFDGFFGAKVSCIDIDQANYGTEILTSSTSSKDCGFHSSSISSPSSGSGRPRHTSLTSPECTEKTTVDRHRTSRETVDILLALAGESKYDEQLPVMMDKNDDVINAFPSRVQPETCSENQNTKQASEGCARG
mmetsp:Transcript_27162/g.55365  ORF Transcript_27162/g.55365 Transcript_27162/m.55365 type:complete len:178 (-) Transcript_27162:98-631(-)